MFLKDLIQTNTTYSQSLEIQVIQSCSAHMLCVKDRREDEKGHAALLINGEGLPTARMHAAHLRICTHAKHPTIGASAFVMCAN